MYISLIYSYLDKMRRDMPNKKSPSANEGIEHCASVVSVNKSNSLLKPSSSMTSHKTSTSSQFGPSSSAKNSIGRESSMKKDRYNLSAEHNNDRKRTSQGKASRRQYHCAVDSDNEYETEHISPLYSNWDQETHEHLLPLQHYIIEQAKLSGNYQMGDALDSDSYHSDSQSEHSLSGHEPDNEDSDHSDGDYLRHDYSNAMDEYGEVYYNVHVGFERQKYDNMSEEVDAKLEREVGQIYSPIKNHPFFQQKEITATVVSKPSPQRQNQPIVSAYQPKTTSSSLSYSQTYSNTNAPTIAKLPPNIGGAPVNQLPIMKECNIEKFAQDNLNLHSKGLFRKKSSLRDMLSWTPDTISRPMLAISRDKAAKKMATEMFKLIQIYMGDRKARDGMSLNSVAMDIISTALTQTQLRDELYIQLCRQTTENHSRESLIRGWELLAICLQFLPPSPTFQPALLK